MAAAIPISHPWGMRRRRGTRSKNTSTSSHILICPKDALARTGSDNSMSPHAQLVSSNANPVSRSKFWAKNHMHASMKSAEITTMA